MVSLLVEHRLDETRGQLRVSITVNAYGYAHFPLVAGIILTTLGVEGVVGYAGSSSGRSPRPDTGAPRTMTDLTAARSIFSADFVSHPLGTVGVDSVVKAWSGLHTTFPDVQVIVEDMLVDADKAAVRTSLHGIPAGVEEQALPSMMEIFRVRDGRIAELWGLSSLSRPGR
ncbi:nuclear transport factor 2 family protein [Streptomyces sp. NPDC051051]|uniref:ester cyclase n=1 Tax=Streptomyces sp. NPDC051051 TaxID=3155666 RepID=UPI003419C915